MKIYFAGERKVVKINLKASSVVRFLSIIAIILITIHIIILFIYFIVNDPEKFDFVRLFDLDMETNIPTLFSSAILLISGFLFYLLSRISQEEGDGNRRAWMGLSWIFLFLAFDESAKIHENIGDYTENFVDASGFLYYPWVISYGIFVMILAAIFLPFFWRVERKVFFSFMLSAVIFLSGAVGFELLGAAEASAHGDDTILYCIYYTIEESLEMFGVIYLIHILLKLLEDTELTVK